jgi:hypothetical protein
MVELDTTLLLTLLPALAGTACFVGALLRETSGDRGQAVTLAMTGALLLVSSLVVAGRL